MTVFYLSVDKLKAKLLLSGQYTQNNLPPDIVLEEVITSLQGMIDLWLGYNILPQDHTIERRAKSNGRIVLPHYPVMKIYSVSLVIPGIIPGAVQQLPGLSSVPSAASIVETEQVLPAFASRIGKDSILTAYPSALFRINYRSGFDPLPDWYGALQEALSGLAMQALSQGGLAFLTQPVRYLNSVNMRNVSQSFSYPSASAATAAAQASGGGAYTKLDEALSRFANFRRTILI
jgi:hypothetical protein